MSWQVDRRLRYCGTFQVLTFLTLMLPFGVLAQETVDLDATRDQLNTHVWQSELPNSEFSRPLRIF